MKRILIVMAILIVIPFLAPGRAAAQSSGCEQTAKDLEAKVRLIMESYDRATYQQLVADDALLINSLGQAKTKKEELDSLERSPDFTMEAFSTKDVRVRACLDTKIVITGKDLVKFRSRGETESSLPSGRCQFI